MKKFKLIASLIGPYLPKTELSVDKFLISFTDSLLESNIPEKPSVGAKDEVQVVLSQEVTFHSNCFVTWQADANSGKVAYEQGKEDLNYLTGCLELPASSYKYFAKIIRVDHIPDNTGPNPESPTSEPIHVLSYEPSELPSINSKYYESLLAIDNEEVKGLIVKFYDGIKSEILSQGDSNLKYYKILEETSNKTLKKLKEQGGNSAPDYEEILREVKELVNSKVPDGKKVKGIKQYSNRLRALDFEQIGERIILTAQKFNMNSEVIATLKNVNKYRAKVIAHAGDEDAEIKLDDPGDIREMARLFILHYINRFHNIQPPDYQAVKENDSWYRYSYSRSDSNG